ncbi:MAG: hypothetical protein WAK93_05695 [Solirubrobacteraceae bacterium]
MASNGKKKTTMAKLNRERKLRERRIDKQAKKDARKNASADQSGQFGDPLTSGEDQPTPSETEDPALDPVASSLVDV